jgi:hypothetical protein
MVKYIFLTQGQRAIIDDGDFNRVSRHKWFAVKRSSGQYDAARNIKNYHRHGTMERLLLSRFITGAIDHTYVVDHINHNPLDNRKSNLRICTQRQNTQNRSNKKYSKFPGVSYDKSAKTKKWISDISINGHHKRLGHFMEEREAATAYEKAVKELCHQELICKVIKG